MHDIRDITLARNGQVALVSYEFKASPLFYHAITGILAEVFIQAPPQLWKLETVRSKPFDTAANTVRLSLRHTYMPKFTVDFAGPSYFGGIDDQLVLCASKGELF